MTKAMPIEKDVLINLLKTKFMSADDVKWKLGCSRSHVMNEVKRNGFKDLTDLRRRG